MTGGLRALFGETLQPPLSLYKAKIDKIGMAANGASSHGIGFAVNVGNRFIGPGHALCTATRTITVLLVAENLPAKLANLTPRLVCFVAQCRLLWKTLANVPGFANARPGKVGEILPEGKDTARHFRGYAKTRIGLREIGVYAGMSHFQQKPAQRVEDSR